MIRDDATIAEQLAEIKRILPQVGLDMPDSDVEVNMIIAHLQSALDTHNMLNELFPEERAIHLSCKIADSGNARHMTLCAHSLDILLGTYKKLVETLSSPLILLMLLEKYYVSEKYYG